MKENSPLNEFERIVDQMDSLFGQTLGAAQSHMNIHHGFDVHQDDDALVVTVDLPGYEKDNIQVTGGSNWIEVSAEADSEVDGEMTYQRRTESFSRRIPLPRDVQFEEAEADYMNGVLTVTLPYSEDEYTIEVTNTEE